MLTHPTVFVLGAGASEPYGFPTGPQLLRNLLLTLHRADRGAYVSAFECLLHLGYSEEKIAQFRDALAASGRTSVDAFLEHRPEFMDIGKVAMAAELIPCEKHNRLFGVDVAANEHWYQVLFNKLSTDFDHWGKNDVAFLTFNYDRSLEYYLITAIRNAYGKSFAEAVKIVEALRFIHLYGDLGQLTEEDAARWRVNDTLNPVVAAAAAKRIHIIHSATGDEKFAVARHFINRARVICFIGFSFHPVNVGRLLDSIHRPAEPVVLSSGYGLARAEQDAIRVMVNKYLPEPHIGPSHHKALYFLRDNFVWW